MLINGYSVHPIKYENIREKYNNNISIRKGLVNKVFGLFSDLCYYNL